MTASAFTLYELNASTFVKSLVLCFTCPFQIAFNRWLACNFNTVWTMGPGYAWSIYPAFAAAILHKNDKQLARNRHYWKQNQKQSKKYSKKKKTMLYPMVIKIETIDGKMRQKLFKKFLGSYSSEHDKVPQNTQVHPHNWNTQNNLTLKASLY